jgi:Ser/Thr protein kinase RdoA (MazF antagonist)
VSTSPGGTATTVDLLSSLERFVTRRHDALNSCQRTVLCHNDFIDENLLVTAAGDPGRYRCHRL